MWSRGGRQERREADILRLIDEGFTALAAGDLAGAAHAGDAILALDGAQVDALYLKGQIAHRQERLDVARDFYEQAILAKPDFADPYLRLIDVLITTDRNQDALAVWQLGLAKAAPGPEALADWCGPMVGNFAPQVREVLKPALAHPQSPWRLWTIAQQVLQRLQVTGGEYEDFMQAMQQRFAGTEGLLWAAAMALSYRNRVDEADAAYAALHERFPNVVAFDGELARAYRETGRHAQALAQATRLAEVFPDNADYAFMVSELRLGEGEIAHGLAQYESRFGRAHGFNSGYLPVPNWQGESIEGKGLLVFDEQGIGDCIMFGRYLPELLRRGVRVRYVCRPAIYQIFAPQPALRDVEVVVRGAGLVVGPETAYHVATVSLARWLGVDRASAGAGSVYLQAQPERAAYWRAQLPRDGRPLVGLVWAANLDTGIGRGKSLVPEMVPEILQHPDVAFVSLQLPREVDAPYRHLYAFAPEIVDFGDTMALIECVDVVVSVDTSVAHLAASMGKRTIVMSKFAPDWRWEGDAREGGRPYWYPEVEVIRQEAPFDWSGAVRRLAGVLGGLAAGPRA